MNQKIFLVTGANTGIGYATALGIAEMDHTVVMVARNVERGEKAQAEIIAATDNQRVHLLLADFASIAQVRTLAETFIEQFPRLDVLINNVGVIPLKREMTENDFEMQFGVNHLAPFLLTNLLLDKLKASAPARVVNLSSQVHSGGKINFDDLQSNKKYRHKRVYANTKLMTVLFTLELARQLGDTGITANCLHPGVINTQLYNAYMGREHSSKDLEDWRLGARTSLYLATSDAVAGKTGGYYRASRPVLPAKAAEDTALAEKLWAVSAAMVGL